MIDIPAADRPALLRHHQSARGAPVEVRQRLAPARHRHAAGHRGCLRLPGPRRPLRRTPRRPRRRRRAAAPPGTPAARRYAIRP